MTVVVKLGGSLFDCEGLANRVRKYLQSFCDGDRVLVVAGGGRFVDAVRFYDRIHSLTVTDSHWLSVDLMHDTAMMVRALLPELALIDTPDLLSDWSLQSDSCDGKSRTAIVSPRAFYARELHNAALPVGWDTTSDSIAAYLARIVNADRLVLLKSVDGDASRTEPIVDANFAAVVAGQFAVQIVNLRESQ